MELNGKITMMISLAIAVVIVTGVMTPIISDTLNGGGSDKGIVNTGEYYLKNIDDDEEHVLSISYTDSSVVVTSDSYTKTMPKSGDWLFPIMMMTFVGSWDEEEYIDTYVWCVAFHESALNNDAETVGPYAEIMYGGLDGMNQANILDTTSEFLTFTIKLTFDTIVTYGYFDKGGDFETETYEDTGPNAISILSENGEWVYSKTPVVSKDTTFYLVKDYYHAEGTYDEGISEYMEVLGQGTITEMQSQEPPLYPYWNYEEYNYFPGGHDIYSYEVTWNAPVWDISDKGSMVTLKKVSLSCTGTRSEDHMRSVGNIPETTEKTFVIDTFLVPVTPVSNGQPANDGDNGSEIPPTLANLVSIVPVLVLAGLVIGTIGYIRRA